MITKDDITIIGSNIMTEGAFENCTSFIQYTTKIDGTTIDDAEDLELAMLMYNLLQYSSNYFYTTSSLWFYSKDDKTYFNNDTDGKVFKSLNYKARLLRKH